MSIIVDGLEDKCRQIVKGMKKRNMDSTPTTFIGREMALILDHIDIIRERKRKLGKRFFEEELRIDAQIMNIDERFDLVPNWLERMKLRNEFSRMLEQAKWQAQRYFIEEESILQQLQSRLLKLLNMYDQLSIDNGDTKSIA